MVTRSGAVVCGAVLMFVLTLLVQSGKLSGQDAAIQTLTKLEVQPTPSTAAEDVVITATITTTDTSDPRPGGVVQFFDTTTAIGAGSVIDEDGSLHAKLTLKLAPGLHQLSARYPGDDRFGPSASVTILHESR